ncbi:hypothetical protein FLAG1_05523 [Fusarium langsethiae]|uniref:Uncharacterized protein n=1 Tax=Fusarium langsethiae TaxID=179993 RepID=A0A0N0V6Y3_FUSLA|nr:hypothetical protein FLAG1_05523 [Fusarium langsethiae]GKU03138.1 unnamed protein product [Fusarium langsethiae]GKU19870.1 unnamed protein product [Fusarium langsethiae]
MLRRNSSRKTNRRPLSRSKSTDSVARSPIRYLESIDPAKAERDANIAAVLSYHRAQDRPSSEAMTIPRDPASFYDKSDGTGSVIRNSPQRTSSALSRHGTPNIARRRSVRFTGPSALPCRNVASRANGGRDSPTKATSTTHAFGKANMRPSSALSFHGEKTNKFSLTRRYLETLQPPDECYNPQEDAVSMSSSYKKIRKSRSMMISSHLAPETVSTKDWTAKNDLRPWSSPLPPVSNDNERLKDVRPKTTALRAATSMTFLRSRRKTAASRASSHVEDNDAVLRLARERFRQIQEEEATKNQQFTLSRPKTRESQRSTTLRKSFRNSSNNSAALSSTFSTNSASVSKQHGIRNTARKVSHGLRSKLRGLFSKGKSEDSEQLEYDQCAAERDSDGQSCLHVGHTETTEEASMFRATSHVRSLHDVPSNKKLRSLKGSVESFIDGDHCVSDDRSRVTSWTNSMTNTVTSQETAGDKERQRLSVIKENGAHVATSVRSTDQQTMEVTTEMPIGSDRVYSALMGRLGKKGIEERTMPPQYESVTTTENDFEKNRENCEAMNKQWPHSTIRCVQPDDDVCKDHERQSSISSSVTEVPDKDSNYATETFSGTKQGHTTAWDWSDDKANSDSERTGVLLNGLDPHKTISDRSSAFFASPSRESFRTPSPYRRALREMNSSEEVNGGLLGSQYLHSLSTLNLPARQDSNLGSEKDFHATDVDSVYSFSADDATPLAPATGSNILEQSPGRRYTGQSSPEISIYAPAHEHQRDTSTASSVEWKTWLSSKVSKLEGPSTPTTRKQDSGALPPLGHVRELASMGSTPELCASMDKRTPNRSPLGSVKGNAQSFPDSNSPTRLSRRVVIGYDENSAPNYEEKTTDEEKTPSIPRRSTLRAVPSLPSVITRGNLTEKGPGREMQRMRSLNTIGRLNSTPEESITKRRSRTRVAGWQGSPTRSSPGVSDKKRVLVARPTDPPDVLGRHR